MLSTPQTTFEVQKIWGPAITVIAATSASSCSHNPLTFVENARTHTHKHKDCREKSTCLPPSSDTIKKMPWVWMGCSLTAQDFVCLLRSNPKDTRQCIIKIPWVCSLLPVFPILKSKSDIVGLGLTRIEKLPHETRATTLLSSRIP